MLTIVKVGGSLFAWPDFRSRLSAWVQAQTGQLVLVPGGGAAANVIRDLDKLHHLGEEKSHWLALRAMDLNGHFLQSLFPAAPLVVHPLENQTAHLSVLEVLPFAQADEGCPGCLPHTWSVTSDSVAARAAVVARADRLILLKSITIPPGMSWPEASRQGLVDALFATVVSQAPGLHVSTINLREGWYTSQSSGLAN